MPTPNLPTLALLITFSATSLAFAQAAESSADAPFDVDFAGGLLSGLLKQLDSDIGFKPNILLDPKAADLVLPAFSLRQVTLQELFSALDRLNRELDVDAGRGSSIFIITRQVQQHVPFAQRQVRPFNVSSFLKDLTIEDIVTAIETSWELLATAQEPAVRYHEETKLLIVAGSSGDLHAAEQVLEALLPPPPAPAPQPVEAVEPTTPAKDK